MAFAVWLSMFIAYRVRPVFRVMTPEQQSLERYRIALDPLRKLALFGVPIVLGLLAGVSATAEWKDQKSLQAFCFDTYEEALLTGVLVRGLAVLVGARWCCDRQRARPCSRWSSRRTDIRQRRSCRR